MSAYSWSQRPLTLAAVVLASAAAFGSPVQKDQPSVTSAEPGLTNNQTAESAAIDGGRQKAAEQESLGKPAISPAAGEVLKMYDAGVSTEVLKMYVESAQFSSPVTSSDMIALKEHGVADDIAMALLKRSAELAQQSQRNASPVANSANAALRNNSGNLYYLDPESYEYFQYYYLYPRTLANAYDRLGYYPSPFYPGYYRGPGHFLSYRHRGFYP